MQSTRCCPSCGAEFAVGTMSGKAGELPILLHSRPSTREEG